MEEKHLFTKEQKTEWFGDGEWTTEPDAIRFEHCGFKCSILRTVVEETNGDKFGGFLCGYVEVPQDHPWAQSDKYPDVQIHGGITCFEKSENGKTVGFDCAHSGDLAPSFEIFRKRYRTGPRSQFFEETKKMFPDNRMLNPTYKSIAYVIEETKSLAEQAKGALDDH